MNSTNKTGIVEDYNMFLITKYFFFYQRPDVFKLHLIDTLTPQIFSVLVVHCRPQTQTVQEWYYMSNLSGTLYMQPKPQFAVSCAAL